MQSTKKEKTKKPSVKEVPLEDELSFEFREFLETTNIASCMNTLTDLLLYREEGAGLINNEQHDLRAIFYFFREIHKKTHKQVAGLM